MKLLIDEQMPPLLAEVPRRSGLEAGHATDFGLTGRADTEVWAFACAGGWTVVSKDADYPAMLSAKPPHCPVIWARIGNASNRRLIDAIVRDCNAAVAAIEAGAMLVEVR